MSFLERNLSSLQRLSPDAPRQIRSLPERAGIEFRAAYSKGGQPTLGVVANGGVTWLHTEDEAPRDAAGSNDQHKTLIVVLGFGLGCHVEEIVKQVPINVPLLIVERSPHVFKKALELRDFTKLFGRKNIHFFLGAFHAEKLRRQLKTLFRAENFGRDSILVIPHKPSFELFPEDYRKFDLEIRDTTAAFFLNILTKIQEAPKWVLNGLQNLLFAWECVPCNLLFKQWKGKPAVVVSAGPSLDTDAEKLRSAKGKTLILCVGTALRVLKKNGVEPDVVFSADSSREAYRHILGIKTENTFLLTDFFVYPETFKEYPNRKFLARVSHTDLNPVGTFVEKTWGPMGHLDGAFSVSTVAFSLAEKMGADPIILVGQDLSFPGGKSHATGTLYQHMVNLKHPSLFHLPSNSGKQVATNMQWLGTLRRLEDAVGKFKGRCINTSREGAAISGAPYMELSRAIEVFCANSESKQTPQEVLSNCYRAHRPKKEKVKALRDGLLTETENMKNLQNLSETLLKNRRGISVKNMTAQFKTHPGMYWLNPFLEGSYIALIKTVAKASTPIERLDKEKEAVEKFCLNVSRVSSHLIHEFKRVSGEMAHLKQL